MPADHLYGSDVAHIISLYALVILQLWIISIICSH